ncbi:hypothetical protein COO60DRAFT_952662 [Scenedesmus sp. NREL 46B-D3]|nr:hypothetical protein COO60DRAFT_952662 [Scenedesmus sp. NREL 46B-D3]
MRQACQFFSCDNNRRRQAAASTAVPGAAATAAGKVPPQLPGANATGAVEMRLPFRVSAALEAPAGALKAYTCDMLFSTDQALQAFTSSLQTALTAQLLPLDIDSINVTQLSCNGDSYWLTRPAQWDAWPGMAGGAGGAEAAQRSSKQQQQQQQQQHAGSTADLGQPSALSSARDPPARVRQ